MKRLLLYFLLLIGPGAGLTSAQPPAPRPGALPAVPDSLRAAYQAASRADAARQAVLLRISRAYLARLDSAGTVGYALAAEQLARQAGDSMGVAQGLDLRGNYYAQAGHLRVGVPLLHRAERLLRERPAASAAYTHVLHHLGMAYGGLGSVPKALAYFRQARARFGQAGIADQVAEVLNSIGLLYTNEGQADSASYYLFRAVRAQHRLGRPVAEAASLGNLALLYANQGDSASQVRAAGYASRAYALELAAHDTLALSQSLSNMAAIALQQRHLPDALRYQQQADALFRRTRQTAALAISANTMGLIFKLQHQPDSASAWYQRAIRLNQLTDDQLSTGLAMTNLASLYLSQHQPALATQWANTALALPRAHELNRIETGALNVLRQVAEQGGDFRGAYEAAERMRKIEKARHASQEEQAVADLRVGYETEQAEQQVALLTEQQEVAALRRQRELTWGGLGVAGLLVLAGAGWRAARKRRRAREEALRNRIAADLHDDVGSLLTQISLESEMLREGLYAPHEQAQQLGRLADVSRTAVRQMNDVVWGLDTRHDSFADLLDRLRDHAYETLTPAGLEIDFAADPDLNARPLRLEARQSLYLIYKEALHNVVKHARGATLVQVRLSADDQTLTLRVRDDGQSAKPKNGNGAGGHGQGNMAQRAAAVGGSLRSGGCPAGGFEVVAELPLG